MHTCDVRDRHRGERCSCEGCNSRELSAAYTVRVGSLYGT